MVPYLDLAHWLRNTFFFNSKLESSQCWIPAFILSRLNFSVLFYQGAVAVSRISQGVTSSIAEACNCSYSVANIVDGSVLLQCRDSISAEVSMEIKTVKGHSVNQLICQFHNLLIQHKNVIDLGKFLPRCAFLISSWKQDRKNWTHQQ